MMFDIAAWFVVVVFGIGLLGALPLLWSEPYYSLCSVPEALVILGLLLALGMPNINRFGPPPSLGWIAGGRGGS